VVDGKDTGREVSTRKFLRDLGLLTHEQPDTISPLGYFVLLAVVLSLSVASVVMLAANEKQRSTQPQEPQAIPDDPVI
jgi:hypothetical protein